MVFEENFWRLTVTVNFEKNEYLKSVDSLIFIFN